MKQFDNKSVTITLNNGDTIDTTYADLSLQAINSPPEKGFDLETYQTLLNVRSALKQAKETVKLEDAEHQALVTALANFKPAILDENIMAWINAVREAK
jgi:hypothetical protein